MKENYRKIFSGTFASVLLPPVTDMIFIEKDI